MDDGFVPDTADNPASRRLFRLRTEPTMTIIARRCRVSARLYARTVVRRGVVLQRGGEPMAPLPPFPWIDVAIILALVALNGVFAMSELAIVSARKARLEAMARSASR
jgi:hypothetical protein